MGATQNGARHTGTRLQMVLTAEDERILERLLEHLSRQEGATTKAQVIRRALYHLAGEVLGH